MSDTLIIEFLTPHAVDKFLCVTPRFGTFAVEMCCETQLPGFLFEICPVGHVGFLYNSVKRW